MITIDFATRHLRIVSQAWDISVHTSISRSLILHQSDVLITFAIQTLPLSYLAKVDQLIIWRLKLCAFVLLCFCSSFTFPIELRLLFQNIIPQIYSIVTNEKLNLNNKVTSHINLQEIVSRSLTLTWENNKEDQRTYQKLKSTTTNTQQIATRGWIRHTFIQKSDLVHHFESSNTFSSPRQSKIGATSASSLIPRVREIIGTYTNPDFGN